MSVPDEVRRDAEKTGELVRKKLMEIMDLQADIDTLLRDHHPTPFGSKNWQYACMEALQRVVAMTAIQFVLFEPVGRVKGNDEFKVAADKMIEIIARSIENAQDEEIRLVTNEKQAYLTESAILGDEPGKQMKGLTLWPRKDGPGFRPELGPRSDPSPPTSRLMWLSKSRSLWRRC